jgi:dolichol-phosphate mannosyltransferase
MLGRRRIGREEVTHVSTICTTDRHAAVRSALRGAERGRAAPPTGAPPRVALTIIVPTKDERGNVRALLERIAAATPGLDVEVIFVDDSTDDTAQVVRDVSDGFPFDVRLIARPPERRNGLGKAVVEGMRAARHGWICVLDGDLQHPPEVIPQLLAHAFATGSDVVAASRLTAGGGTEGLSLVRTIISRALAAASRLLFARRLHHVTDPLTGFFIARRSALDPDALQPEGFKILLEVLIRSPRARASEIPFEFGERFAGQSKANTGEALQLFRQMLRLSLLGQKHLLRFLAVGASGIVVNSLLMALFTEAFGVFYIGSALLATQGSSLWNFGLSETWVFDDRVTARGTPWQRFGRFMVMNNAALAARAPLLALLVAFLGMHYLGANVISLVLIALLRFAIADRLIWSAEERAPESEPWLHAKV